MVPLMAGSVGKLRPSGSAYAFRGLRSRVRSTLCDGGPDEFGRMLTEEVGAWQPAVEGEGQWKTMFRPNIAAIECY